MLYSRPTIVGRPDYFLTDQDTNTYRYFKNTRGDVRLSKACAVTILKDSPQTATILPLEERTLNTNLYFIVDEDDIHDGFEYAPKTQSLIFHHADTYISLEGRDIYKISELTRPILYHFDKYGGQLDIGADGWVEISFRFRQVDYDRSFLVQVVLREDRWKQICTDCQDIQAIRNFVLQKIL